MSIPASPQPSRRLSGHHRDADRLDELNAELSKTLKELILLHSSQIDHPFHEEAQPETKPHTFPTIIKTVPGRLWRLLRKHRAAISELCIIALTVLSVWYAVRAINLAQDAISIGQSWSKTSYENALFNTWSGVQAACKENRTVFPVSESMFKDWAQRPGVECTSKETCVCEVIDPSAYVGDQILSVYYPFLNSSDPDS